MVALGPELIIIFGILAVIFIWGPQKLPEVARSIGRARKEFEEASKGITQTNYAPRIEASAQDPLIDVAQKLGISTQGKTRLEISDEIVKAAQSKR